MNPLIKIMLTLAIIFASTFIIIKSTGILTIKDIEGWLESAKTLSPVYVAGIIILLLIADLFIAVPTMALMMLGGYFLGHSLAAASAITGLILSGTMGYILSHIYGEKLVSFLIKEPHKQLEAKTSFQKHGIPMILLSRALPILPEITSCMAGATKMRFSTFFLAWSASTVPYAIIATYAGSISTLDNPKPAIIAAIGLTGSFWLGWFIFKKIQKTKIYQEK